MPQKTDNPIISDEFLDQVAKEINEQYGGPAKEKMISTIIEIGKKEAEYFSHLLTKGNSFLNISPRKLWISPTQSFLH